MVKVSTSYHIFNHSNGEVVSFTKFSFINSDLLPITISYACPEDAIRVSVDFKTCLMGLIDRFYKGWIL